MRGPALLPNPSGGRCAVTTRARTPSTAASGATRPASAPGTPAPRLPAAVVPIATAAPAAGPLDTPPGSEVISAATETPRYGGSTGPLPPHCVAEPQPSEAGRRWERVPATKDGGGGGAGVPGHQVPRLLVPGISLGHGTKGSVLGAARELRRWPAPGLQKTSE